MVALFMLLADEDDRRIRLILAAFGIVAVVLVGAGLIELVKRCETKKVNTGPTPSRTNGLRYTRYLKRSQRERDRYS